MIFSNKLITNAGRKIHELHESSQMNLFVLIREIRGQI